MPPKTRQSSLSKFLGSTASTATENTTTNKVTKKRKLSGKDQQQQEEEESKFMVGSLKATASSVSDSMDIKWFETPNILIAQVGSPQTSNKIAAFDLDGTLIRPKSKYKVPKDGDDWTFAFPKISEKLHALYHDEKYHISILSNQKGLYIEPGEKNPKRELAKNQLKMKIFSIAKQLGIPFWFFAGKSDDIFRKPRIGMWLLMALHANSGQDIDIKSSFYVGDALGRPKGWMSQPSKDFADTDLKFALNIGVEIKVPELFFNLYSTAPEVPKPIHCKDIPATHTTDSGNVYDGNLDDFLAVISCSLEKKEKFMVIMIGSPASGKSSFVQSVLVEQYGIERINQDTLKTFKKCLDLAEENLKLGKNVVIDNTNGPKQTRSSYIRLAKSYKYKVFCAHRTTNDETIAHNNNYRAVSSQLKATQDWIQIEGTSTSTSTSTEPEPESEPYATQKLHAGFRGKKLEEILEAIPKQGNFVSRIVFNTYKSRLEIPTKTEGFDAIFALPFTPSFNSEQDQVLWSTWLC